MSEVKQESVDSGSTAEPTKEKGKLAPVGLLAIILTPLVVITSLFFSYGENGTFYPPENNEINLDVTLSAQQFLEFSNSNVCDGKAPLVGLSAATLQIRGAGWSKQTVLGEGVLNVNGDCQYKTSVTAPQDFAGGKISAKILFTFGNSEDFSIDVGDSPPFESKNLTINLG
jgi:hypothetical protein